jgi:soluble lytic murein transglycosylase-like protein
MSSHEEQNKGQEALVLLLVIALLFFNPFSFGFKRYEDERVSAPTSDNLYFHVARFYGAEVTPTKSIIEQEIEKVADEFGIHRSIFKALVKVESGGNPKALSPVGARGIAQIMPFNAKRCGLASAEKLWDALLNLRCGAQILSEEIQEHGNVHAALTVYNCGKVACRAGQQYASKVLAISKKMY